MRKKPLLLIVVNISILSHNHLRIATLLTLECLVLSCNQESLSKLMITLRTTESHFVRCIIPNEIRNQGNLVKSLNFHKYLKIIHTS